MTIDEFLSKLEKVKRNENGWIACCPSHDDRTPSLSIAIRDGKILIRCFAGCSPESIVQALDLTMRDLHIGDGPEDGSNKRRVNEAVYQYKDEDGTLLYEKVRYRPKGFGWRRSDGNGAYLFNLDGVPRVPYRLPELLEAMKHGDAEVWFAEGEKDTDSLLSLGSTATSFKDWSPTFNPHIKGVHAVLFRDHDPSGLKQANDAARIIAEVAKSVKVIDLYEGYQEQGQDVSDWIESRRAEGLGRDDIAEALAVLAEGAAEWQDEPVQPEAITTTNGNGLEIEFLSTVTALEVSWLARPLIPFGFFTLLDGIEGIGKTYAMLDIAKRLTLGLPMPFHGEEHEAANALFLSVEDSPEYILKPRFEKMKGDCSRLAVLRGNFTFSDAGFADLEQTIEEHAIKFVLIDPLFSFTGGADINKASDVRRITDRLNKLAASHGIAIVGVRHINKSKGSGEARSAGSHGVAWLQGCRSGLIVGHDVEDKSKRGVAQHKLNVAAESNTVYGFEIDQNGAFRWTGESDLSISEMLAHKANESNDDRSALAEAIRFLSNSLADGGRPAIEIESEARAAGISKATLRRGKARLRIKSEKIGPGDGWMWVLPEDARGSQDAH